jgi:predicted GNAT family acetyltransferase
MSLVLQKCVIFREWLLFQTASQHMLLCAQGHPVNQVRHESAECRPSTVTDIDKMHNIWSYDSYSGYQGYGAMQSGRSVTVFSS